MITGLRGTSIWSEDLNNLLPFYRDVLGLEVTTETPSFVVLGGLWLGTHSEVHGRNADLARHMVGLTSNDLTGDWKRLKDAGVEFVEDPTDYGSVPGGRRGQVRDLRHTVKSHSVASSGTNSGCMDSNGSVARGA